MSITLRLVDSNAKISSDINAAIANHMNVLLKKKINKIRDNIKKLVPGWILEQPEINSLMDEGVQGSLNAEFGLYPGASNSAVVAITNAVKESVAIKIDPIYKNLQGGMTISIQPNTFSNLLGLTQGYTATPEASLHWLDWLLIQGDRTIVVGYYYKPSKEGRGGAGTKEIGGFWRVDPRYSGNISDNFITRALSGREKDISSVIDKAMK